MYMVDGWFLLLIGIIGCQTVSDPKSKHNVDEAADDGGQDAGGGFVFLGGSL